ncbi:MAG: DUF1499 domain-containing protein [Pseudomonadales bacterium]|nr:DUF1499 domain-containing protein [Pseudomonadales bacterium]
MHRSLAMVGLLSLLGCAGERPANLGVHDGQLGTCPDSPNCVSTAEQRDSHRIDPIRGTLAQIRQVLPQMPGARIIREEDDYLYAEFTSRLMGFVDDVEFLEQEAGLVQVRSASRLGHSDLGVNRARIETLRQAVAALP